MSEYEGAHHHHPMGRLALRGGLGGILMGLANLVPGISGGTMLLAAGVYTAFIDAIAEVTTFRFRTRSILLLAVVAGAAGLAILTLAGTVRALVIEQRWVMYSLFIGLTLGGVPLVWRRAQPITPAVWGGAAVGFVLMLAMAFAPGAGESGDEARTGLLLLSGTAGAGAMILPGVSGGYLLLLLGQYLPILGAIDQLKEVLLGLREGALDTALAADVLGVITPVGIGVVIGIIGISNLLHWTLERFPKATLGVLLGLLVGAVAGLWPYQQGVPPQVGDVFKGRVLSEQSVREVDPEDWPLARFTPSGGQLGGGVALVVLGLGITLGIARIGNDEEDD